MFRHNRPLQAFGTVLAAAAIWLSPVASSHADAPPNGSDADLRDAGRILDDVPPSELYSPAELRRIADRARRQFWRLPEDRSWPVDRNGWPVVRTRQVDRLVAPVESAGRLAQLKESYRVSDRELRRWNPSLDFRDFDDTRQVVVWQRRHGVYSASSGEASWGRLYYGEPLPPDPERYRIVRRYRAFGTYYTISEVRRVMTTFHERYPDSHPLIVGDISTRGGGSMYPHRSHQSGRDVDISYPRREPPESYRSYRHVAEDELAAEKALFFLRTLLAGGHVRYVFIDFGLQRVLYEMAERKGAPESWLDRVFAYPEFDGRGIVRHEPGHDDHMHIRFRCQPTDRDCGR